MSLEEINIVTQDFQKKNFPFSKARVGHTKFSLDKEIFFVLHEIHNLTTLGSDPFKNSGCNHFIILYDISSDQSLIAAIQLIKYIKQDRTSPFIFLVMNKIDKFASTSLQIRKIFTKAIKTSIKYDCKLIPLTLRMNKTNLKSSVFIVLRNCIGISLSSSELTNLNYVFDDEVPIRKEDFLSLRSYDFTNSIELLEQSYCSLKGLYPFSSPLPSSFYLLPSLFPLPLPSLPPFLLFLLFSSTFASPSIVPPCSVPLSIFDFSRFCYHSPHFSHRAIPRLPLPLPILQNPLPLSSSLPSPYYHRSSFHIQSYFEISHSGFPLRRPSSKYLPIYLLFLEKYMKISK